MSPRPIIAAILAATLAACGAPRPAGDAPAPAAAGLPPVQAVPQVDLQRYAGKWFELARLPGSTRSQCVSDTSLHYLPREKGGFELIGRCRTAKGVDESDGSADILPDSGGARMKVSYLWPFGSEQWVVGLDPNYRWAVVGTPDRRYLWLLARSRDLPRAERDKALAAAREQGYDVDRLEDTPHDQGV